MIDVSSEITKAAGQVWRQVRDQVRDQVWGQVYGQVVGQVWADVRVQFYNQVRTQLER